MSEELKNNNININAKCEDMILSAKSIVEHHLFVSDGRCEPPSYICLAYDVKNYLPKLLQENRQLKDRINKATDYIEKCNPDVDLHSMFLNENYISNYGACELLEILKGVKNG